MSRLYCLLLLLFAFSVAAQISPASGLSKHQKKTDIGITFNYGTGTDSAIYYLQHSEKWARQVLISNNQPKGTIFKVSLPEKS